MLYLCFMCNINCNYVWDYLFHASLPHPAVCSKSAEAISYLFTAWASLPRKRAWKKVLNIISRKRERRRKERGRAEKKEVQSYSYKPYSRSKTSRGLRSIDTQLHWRISSQKCPLRSYPQDYFSRLWCRRGNGNHVCWWDFPRIVRYRSKGKESGQWLPKVTHTWTNIPAYTISSTMSNDRAWRMSISTLYFQHLHQRLTHHGCSRNIR